MAAWNNSNYIARPKDLTLVDRKKYDPILVKLLGLCTPNGFEFHISNYIQNLDFIKKSFQDGIIKSITEIEGNLLIKVGDTSKSLFSCHMDIIGNVGKENKEAGKVDIINLMRSRTTLYQDMIYGAKYIYDPKTMDFLRWEGCPLGADDKAGVWICLKMIEAKIPGLYVFHVGEEQGGTGSRLLTTKHVNLFEGYQRAIAFDRAGYGDIIEFQRGGRCCSIEFGKALAEELNAFAPPFEQFKSGITGTFTDTAMYREIIPECTNVSVGYFQQHGDGEHLDVVWLQYILMPFLKKVQWENLPSKRDPKEKPVNNYGSGYNYGNGWQNNNRYRDDKNKNRKTWKNADVNTQTWEMPLWIPKDGYIANAPEGLLRKAIQAYVRECYTIQDKEELADHHFDVLEELHLAEQENKLLRDQLKRLTNMEDHGTVEDIDIYKKKKYLTKLIEVADTISLENNNEAFQRNAKYAKKLLKIIAPKLTVTNFTKKEMKKVNKCIFGMTYYLSYEVVLSEEHLDLLQELYEFISTHHQEEGFNQMPGLRDEVSDNIMTGETITIYEPTADRVVH